MSEQENTPTPGASPSASDPESGNDPQRSQPAPPEGASTETSDERQRPPRPQRKSAGNRKGRGGGGEGGSEDSGDDSGSSDDDDSGENNRGGSGNRNNRNRNRRSRKVSEGGRDRGERVQAPSFKVDAKDLKSKAWKIYVAELGEEGIELFDDAQAAKLAQRAFKLAEIFLYHQSAILDRIRTPKESARGEDPPAEEAKASDKTDKTKDADAGATDEDTPEGGPSGSPEDEDRERES
ncbi:hypothetical protein BH23VER1_BH23VER1_07730 [soil metagenome]